MKERNPRRTALDILTKLEEQVSNSGVLLQNALSQYPEASDRHLITDLVLGVLRWRSNLLFLIQSFSRRPLDSIDRKVLLILEMGIYQLTRTSIPHHAAVYETVNLVRRVKLTSAASFVNGILRAVQSRLDSLPQPDPADPVFRLSVQWSHPEWLVRRWIQRFGEQEAGRLMETNNRIPFVFIRVNSLLTDKDAVSRHLKEEGIVLEPGENGDVFKVKEGSPQLTRSFVDGEFYIQDAGIELLGKIMAPKEGSRILEIAAAPGGKTFQLALRMNNRGLIVSMDSDIKRMKMWRRNIERLNVTCAVPLVSDARALPLLSTFDSTIVDAPCSSIGVIRRHPEIKWWRKEEDLKQLGRLQLQILESCAKYVRDQGALIYSVCSFEPEETDEVCAQFLSAHPEYTETARQTLFPHRDQADGFFISKFIKRKE
jgi:16S rRNA (cytosine967-C5)-methyltransferase